MAKSKQQKLVITDGMAEFGDAVARLLDPHLQSGLEENVGRAEPWPLRKTILYVVGTAVVLWAMIAAAFWLLFIR